MVKKAEQGSNGYTNWVSLEEAATRAHLKIKTLRNWISTRRLGGAQGLVYVGSRPVIDWPLFEKAFVRRAA
jgi:hypothetical protein